MLSSSIVKPGAGVEPAKCDQLIPQPKYFLFLSTDSGYFHEPTSYLHVLSI